MIGNVWAFVASAMMGQEGLLLTFTILTFMSHPAQCATMAPSTPISPFSPFIYFLSSCVWIISSSIYYLWSKPYFTICLHKDLHKHALNTYSLVKSTYKLKEKNFRSDSAYMLPGCGFFQERSHAGERRKVLMDLRQILNPFVIKHTHDAYTCTFFVLSKEWLYFFHRWGSPALDPLSHSKICKQHYCLTWFSRHWQTISRISYSTFKWQFN